MTIEESIEVLQKFKQARLQFAATINDPENEMMRWAAVMRHPKMMNYSAEFAVAFTRLTTAAQTYKSEHNLADLTAAQTIFDELFLE